MSNKFTGHLCLYLDRHAHGRFDHGHLNIDMFQNRSQQGGEAFWHKYRLLGRRLLLGHRHLLLGHRRLHDSCRRHDPLSTKPQIQFQENKQIHQQLIHKAAISLKIIWRDTLRHHHHDCHQQSD